MLWANFSFAQSAKKESNNSSISPYAKLKSTDIDDVQWTEGFWADRFELCHQVMAPNMWRLLEDPDISHAYDNFLIAAGLKEGRHRGPTWLDGDFYKWLEAAAFTYGMTKDEELDRLMDQIIDVIGKAQRQDGYIHTPVLIEEKHQNPNTTELKNRLDFETYNMGHLMTCACIHYRATGKTDLLQIARNSADYLYNVYKTEPQKLANNAICPSHYMGIIDMYRTTQDPRYIELAAGFIDIRGMVKDGTDHNQDRIPFVEQTQAVGHAVRANYLYAGVADVYAETGNEALLKTLDRIWRDVAYRKMYITGATGALYDGASPDGAEDHTSIQLVHQAYGRPFQLPNLTAYNESCATVGYVLWNRRMLALTGRAEFADMLELALYNGILSAISLDGKKFFYTNPLRVVDNPPFELRWSRQRQSYISCFCCPPNVVRTIAEVANHVYSISEQGVYVNLYGGCVLDTQTADGRRIKLTQQTNYPWDGTIKITIEEAPSGEAALFLRIPGWSKQANIKVNNQLINRDLKPQSYYQIKRTWTSGDRVELHLPMPVQLIEANPLVEETRNQVAVKRGPIVYCLESVDLPEDVKISDVAIQPENKFTSRFDQSLLEGITVLEGKGAYHPTGNWNNTLYREMSREELKDVTIRLVPCYAWGNRGHSEMTVWMPVR